MKTLVKAAVNGVMALLVLPLVLVYYLCWPLMGGEAAFQMMSQLISLAPGLPGNYLRHAFYRFTLAACGADACINFGTILSKPDAHIAPGAYLGARCSLGRVTIGANTMLANGVEVPSGMNQHHFDDTETPIKDQGGTFERVTIGEDCWIGTRAVVMADVGDHSVVAAGSVVTKPIPAWSVAAGTPAKVIRTRSKSEDEHASEAAESVESSPVVSGLAEATT